MKTKPRAPRRGAARGGGLEWLGGIWQAPFYTTDAGDEPHRPSAVLWLELPSGLVVGSALVEPAQARGAVGRVLARALRRPMAGPPRRPERIRVADASLVAEIRAALDPHTPIRLTPTPELDEVLEKMWDALADANSDDEGEDDSYLEDGRLSPALVEHLFRCAARLHQAAPWAVAGSDQLLRLDSPALGVEGACISINGREGKATGILIFPSLEACELFAERAQETPAHGEPTDLGTEFLALAFDLPEELPPRMLREATAHAWPLASAHAYPRVSAWDADAVCRPLQERDVRIAATCAAALASFVERHRAIFRAVESPPLRETYPDESPLGAAATISAPYEAPELVASGTATIAEEAPAQARRPSRNAPCPCGSGKKYKKCHLPIDEAAEAPRRRAQALHALSARLTLAVLELAAQREGESLPRHCRELVTPREGLPLALAVAAYAEERGGSARVDHFLAARGKRLRAEERSCLLADRAAWLSLWEVTEVERGQGVALRDLLSGEERRVLDTACSQTVSVYDVVLCRVMDFGGLSLCNGLHPYSLPPLPAASLVARVRKRLRRRGPAPVERLRAAAFAHYLIACWEEHVAEAHSAAALPELRNSDGDALLFTTDHFALDAPARNDVARRLAALEGVRREGDAGAGRFVFLAARRAGALGETVLGEALLSGAFLRLEANSRERADALRARVEAACGDALRHRAREHADPLSRRAPEPGPRPAPTPEMQQLALDFKREHYRDWLDHPLPALEGQTPRAAARTASGRASLVALLETMERLEARDDEGSRYDFNELRRALGLLGVVSP